MNRLPPRLLALAVSMLALSLMVAAASAGPESQSGGEAGKGGAVGAAPDIRSTPLPPAPQPAPDRPPAQTQPKPEPEKGLPPAQTQSEPKSQESPPPLRDKPEQDVPPAESKPETGTPGAKTLKPISPDEAVGILGKKVHGPAGEDMGMIVDVLVDGDSKPRAALIDFGGFLGVGTRKIATDWQLLQFRPGDRTQPVLLTIGQAELRAAPEYKPSGQPAEIIAPPPPETPAAPDAEK